MSIRTYTELKKRIDALAATFLPANSLTGSYSPRENDLIRSYVLLAHAEIESFCEDLALHVVKEAQRRSVPTRCSSVISRLVLYRAAWGNRDLEVLSEELIVEACDFFRSQVGSNHGVKRENLLRLFIPLGLSHNDFDETLLATLDSFGTQRGDFAHRSTKTLQPLDPVSEKARVDLIMPELARVDQIARALIPR